MNKVVICTIIALTLSTLWLLPAIPALATSTANLSSYGLVQFSNPLYGTPINKALIAYTYFAYASSTERAFAGTSFSVLNIYLDDSVSALQSIKAVNPDVKILGYKSLIAEYSSFDDWSVVNSHEDWFVHDASGNRIRSNQFGYYLMDVSSLGWKQHWVAYVNAKFNLPASVYYDGVFIDDVYNSLNSDVYSSVIPVSVLSYWKSNNIAMLQNIKASLSNKIVFINSDEMNTDSYLSLVDGQMIEGYEHAPWDSVDTYSGISFDILARKSATNKIVWAASGTISSTDTEKMARLVKYCYASFLIGMNGSQAYWSFNDWGSSDGSKGYYSIMNTNIGQATGPYYTSQNVYMRNYTLGKVLFNPSGNTYTINLGQTYRLLNGSSVSSVTIRSHSAEILLTVA